MARRRFNPGVVVMAVFAVGAAVVVASVFGGLGRGTRAPEDKGVCWRIVPGSSPPQYVTLAKNVANLETCAAHLERIHLQTLGPVDGAYQGRFLFIDTGAIRSATSLEGSRWQVFFAPQRAALDQKLKQGGGTPQLFTMPAR